MLPYLRRLGIRLGEAQHADVPERGEGCSEVAQCTTLSKEVRTLSEETQHTTVPKERKGSVRMAAWGTLTAGVDRSLFIAVVFPTILILNLT